MASNDVKEPFLSRLVGSTAQKNKKDALTRRRFRCCKSAPLAEFVPLEKNGIGPIPRSESIFGKLHPSLKKTDEILAAVYFCIVTMTTVGYGDLMPDIALTKLLACAFVFTGIALIGGLILSKAADYLVEKQEILLAKALHMHQKVGPAEILREVEQQSKIQMFSGLHSTFGAYNCWDNLPSYC